MPSRRRVAVAVVLAALIAAYGRVSYHDRAPGPKRAEARVDVRAVVFAARAMIGTLYDPLGGRLADLGGRLGFLTCADVPALAYRKAGLSLRQMLAALYRREPLVFGGEQGNDPRSAFFERRSRNLYAWARGSGRWLQERARPRAGDLAFFGGPADAGVPSQRSSLGWGGDPVGHVALVSRVDAGGQPWVVEAARGAVLVHEVRAREVAERGWTPRGFGLVLERGRSAASDPSFRAPPPPGAQRVGVDDAAPVPGSAPDDRSVHYGAGCEAERFRCDGGLAARCDGGEGWALATCLRGCAVAKLYEDLPDDAAVAILCER